MSCLFIGIAKFVGGSAEDVRRAVCDFMDDNLHTEHQGIPIHKWIEWQAEAGSGGVQAYIERMRCASTWGGAMELAIATKIYQVDITVVNGSGSVVAEFKWKEHCSARRRILLVWTGAHFEPLVQK